MIADIETYFTKGCGRCARFGTPDCATVVWADGIAALRAICLQAGLSEALKWGHPCYMHAGRNIAIIGATRAGMGLSFFDAALLRDPRGILERQGPNTRHPDMIRFADTRAPSRMADIIAEYLAEAKGYAERGERASTRPVKLDFPKELVDALKDDPELADAFHALTPGRQRSYVMNLSGAKQPQTRRDRILKFRDKIIAGKGVTER